MGEACVVEFVTVLSVAYIAMVAGLAFVMLWTRPKAPSRKTYSELRESAVRTRDVLLPAAAAAVLGIFVSLTASFVHENFSAPIADRFELSAMSYLCFLALGGLVSFALLAVLLEKLGASARDLARHPASINRAATLLGRGRMIEDLEAWDLERSLARWKKQKGKSAARIVVGATASPHLNELLDAHAEVLKSEVLPRGFSWSLFVAKVKHFWWIGFLLPVACGATLLSVVFAWVADVVEHGASSLASWTSVAVLAFLVLVPLSTILYLFADAKYTIRMFRIDRIELRAAERRIEDLMMADREPRASEDLVVVEIMMDGNVGAPLQRGLFSRVYDAVRNR